jgi:5'-deoxynucleotidase YfbR-like HD superfamily hydrolase
MVKEDYGRRKKVFYSGLEKNWPGVADVLLTSQLILQKVWRWKSFKNVRRQNDLQHSYSITILAKIVVEKLNKYFDGFCFDKDIIITAFLVHDHGEGELKRDIQYGKKKESDDLDEYYSFVERYRQLNEEVFSSFHYAYLLQYCVEGREEFPAEAREIMVWLKEKRYPEALIFEAVEIFEYILFALEQDKKGNNKEIFQSVCKNQLTRIERLVRDLPGFREEIWTDEVQSLFDAYLSSH